MLTCSKSLLIDDCMGAMNVLKVQFDSLKEVSLCGKLKAPSEILDNLSWDQDPNISF